MTRRPASSAVSAGGTVSAASAVSATRLARWGVAVLALLLACRTTPSGGAGAQPAASAAAASSAGAPLGASGAGSRTAAAPQELVRHPEPPRLVAIGDLHGDLAATRAALRLAGAVGEDDRWVGGPLVVVQVGDQTDRGPDDRAVLALLERLSDEARAAGGALHLLVGNHELMNAQLDFRYVHRDAWAAYADTPVDARWRPVVERLPPERRGRAAAFLPGGPEALVLARHPVVLLVGRSAFVHGGLAARHLAYPLSRMNAELTEFLTGHGPLPAWVHDGESPVWDRRLAEPEPEPEACRDVGRVLAALDVDRLVVGHTVQRAGPNAACGGRAWRIDSGISEHYGGNVAVLELAGGRATVLRPPG